MPLFTLAAFALIAAAETAAPPALRLAVPDPLGLEQAKKDAAALATFLSDKLHRRVEGEAMAASDLPRAIATGKVDLAWLSASEYVQAVRIGPLQPLARVVRNGLPFYRSVIFARKDSPATALAELKGKKIALVSKTSAAGYILPIVMLRAARLAEPLLLGDHAAVCKAVLDGKADAGATFGNDKDGKTGIEGCSQSFGARAAELKVLAVSHPIPNDVIAARPGLAPADVEPLRLLLGTIAETPEGKAILTSVFHGEGFLGAGDDDFVLFRHEVGEAGEAP